MAEHNNQHPQHPHSDPQPEQTDRQKRMAERKQEMRDRMPKMETVRVEPASPVLRRAVRHPRGAGFPPTGSVEWPLDRFTKRRIADGTVKVVEQKSKDEAPRDEPAQPQRPRYNKPPEQQPE